jgi:hypothetical protein
MPFESGVFDIEKGKTAGKTKGKDKRVGSL